MSEWADQHRMLSSKASAEPGRWRTSRTPYLKDDHGLPVADLAGRAGGVHERRRSWARPKMGNNWIGYVIHHAPGPMMAVWPTVDMAKRNSKQRIDPLIEESPVLAS